MKTRTHVFKTFPEFSELKLSDRDKWTELISGYPSISDISFGTLMTWWSHLDSPRISQLGKNLVIAYWLPGSEKVSGFSIVGTHHIDEAVCEVFDYLHQIGETARLVHVPEFVVSSMKYLDLYNFESERDFDECVINVSQFALISKVLPNIRWKVRRFFANIDREDVLIKSIDLSSVANQKMLLESVDNWGIKGGINQTSKHETSCTKEAIKQADKLGLENACLFIKGELHGFMLYELSWDPNFAIIGYTRMSYAIPFIFEAAVHMYAQWFLSQGIKYANLVEDAGEAKTRALKLSLGPINFFRKYTIEPRGNKYEN